MGPTRSRGQARRHDHRHRRPPDRAPDPEAPPARVDAAARRRHRLLAARLPPGDRRLRPRRDRAGGRRRPARGLGGRRRPGRDPAGRARAGHGGAHLAARGAGPPGALPGLPARRRRRPGAPADRTAARPAVLAGRAARPPAVPVRDPVLRRHRDVLGGALGGSTYGLWDWSLPDPSADPDNTDLLELLGFESSPARRILLYTLIGV